MENYTVMHLNRETAEIRSDGSCSIKERGFMPYNLWLEEGEDIDTRVNNLANFNYWCASRVLTLDRKYAKEILGSLNLGQPVTDRDRARIAISYHALTLTDVFWVRRSDEQADFDEINLYDHPLTDAFVDVCLRGGSLTAQNAQLLSEKDTAADLGTQGVAPKAWVRRDGGFWLLKDGEKRDVEAELLSSRIADCFDAEHVKYEESEFDGTAVSASRLITSKARSIVPSSHMQIFAANSDVDLHAYIMEKDARAYHMMNIIDYLVGNTDRHWENWGFWMDNSTGRVEKLYPLMDFNKAFSTYDTEEGAICQTTAVKMSQKDAAIEAVRAAGLNMTREPERAMFKGCFADEKYWQMFSRRLEILKETAVSESGNQAEMTL